MVIGKGCFDVAAIGIIAEGGDGKVGLMRHFQQKYASVCVISDGKSSKVV